MFEDIRLTSDTAKALYRQLQEQLAELIRGGKLKPGTRLPSTREAAQRLGVARLTVIAAYEDLQAEGLVEGGVGRGTFVCPPRC